MKRRELALAAAFTLIACTEQALLSEYELREVLGPALELARSAVDSEHAHARLSDRADVEHVRSLVRMLADASPRMRELPLEEVGLLGDAAVDELSECVTDQNGDTAERLAACELLASLATPLASDQLMGVCEHSPEPWLRAQAAWRLGSVGADWLVPRLLLRLKYETDLETIIWIASSLGTYGNFSGLDVLWNIALEPEDRPHGATARQCLEAMTIDAGVESAERLWELWYGVDPGRHLHNEAPSARLVLAVWELIEQLSGEHFQLRGVDDARFVLARLGAWAAAPLAAALHDTDVYVRVHSAQALARMGPRACSAGPELIRALDDPALAPHAAAALAGITFQPAESAIRSVLEDSAAAHELRVACAASLSGVGLPHSVTTLTRVVEDDSEPLDLRQAAAGALVELGAGDRSARFLLRAMNDPDADRSGAEQQLELWLRGREDRPSAALLRAWEREACAPGVTPSAAEAEARRQNRGAMLDKAWNTLPGLR